MVVCCDEEGGRAAAGWLTSIRISYQKLGLHIHCSRICIAFCRSKPLVYVVLQFSGLPKSKSEMFLDPEGYENDLTRGKQGLNEVRCLRLNPPVYEVIPCQTVVGSIAKQ